MPRFDAARADHHALGTSFLQGSYGLQIGIETSFVDVMGMANVVAHHRFLAADFTFLGHRISLPLLEIGC